MSQLEIGSLVTEFSLNGQTIRSFGTLRATAHEDNRDVHLALNSGIPLPDSRGGFWFVFQAGVPVLRRFDQSGELVFERRIEGRELDPLVAKLPTVWTKRTPDGRLP